MLLNKSFLQIFHVIFTFFFWGGSKFINLMVIKINPQMNSVILDIRAVTGTHFATRVPAYQCPAGTRLLGVACSRL